MIQEITDIKDVLDIIPIESMIIHDEPSLGSMCIRDKLTWMDCMMNKKPFIVKYDFRILTDRNEEGKVIAFAVISLLKTTIKYFDEVRIYRVYCEDGHPEIIKEFLGIIEKWAKDNKINVIRAEANKMLNLFKRKYKMIPVSVNMERRL